MPGVFLIESQSSIIASKFAQLRTVEDLAILLNWIEKHDKVSESRTIKPIDAKLLHFLAKTRGTRYLHFNIDKKSGGQREIRTPDAILKRIQRLLNYALQVVFEPHAHHSTNGFLFGRDIIRNAKPHVNKTYVLNCDIKDFFPSINFRRVKTVLGLSPFNLIDDRELIGFLIANLCIHNNSLPQGAPTSPLLSNIVTQNLDRKMDKYCLTRKVKYSRYADDLTFSSNRNLFDKDFLETITRILSEERFQVNESKTRLKTDMDRQQVTGLVVNEKINIKREYLQKVRAMLNNWEKGGLEFAKQRFAKHQPPSRRNFNFIEVVGGHVSFIGNVRGKEDPVFQKLHSKLTILRHRIDYSFITNENVRKRLIGDNMKMEKILLDKIHSTEDKFIAFCTSAFHQIENLLNYYYWKRFPDFADLLEFLLVNNPRFKSRYNNLNSAKNHIKKFKDLNINVLLFIFEKEFYIGPKMKYYDRRLSKLREIRNDDSHRCSVIEYDKAKVLLEYQILQIKKEGFHTKHKRYMVLSMEENEIEFKFNLIVFLEKMDYKFVRGALKEICAKIVRDLKMKYKSGEVGQPT